MAYDVGKLVRADNALNMAVGNALRIDEKAGKDIRTRIQRNSMMESGDVVAAEKRYKGNFNIVDMSYQKEDGTFLQCIKICGRNVDWDKVSNHIFTNISEPNVFYLNGEKKQWEISAIYQTYQNIEQDVTWYLYFYVYSDNELYIPYLYPVIHRERDISIEQAKEYIEGKNISVITEPSNIITIGSFRFNSDGTTEIEQIFKDDGIPNIYMRGIGDYSGPFMVTWIQSGILNISAPLEFVGGNDYAGSILAPDMQVIKHIPSTNESFTEGQENTLLVLKVTWFDDGDVLASFNFVPDPWKTCSEENRFITIDHLNPKSEQYPYRNPYIAIYPIARIEGIKIAQIQRGHIVEYNRWWRV